MYFISQTLVLLEKHNAVIKSWFKRDTKTTDRHTGRGKGCRVWCLAWRRGWRLPLCWTETRCLCAAPVWLWMGKEEAMNATWRQLFHNEQSTFWLLKIDLKWWWFKMSVTTRGTKLKLFGMLNKPMPNNRWGCQDCVQWQQIEWHE